VVEGAKKIEVQMGQMKYNANVIMKDAYIDVALLKIENWQGEVLPLMSSSEVKMGDPVFTLGFPNMELQGTEVKYTEGTISSLSGIANNPRHFQISTPVQSGNSGGPLVNEAGEVVGIVVAKLDEEYTYKITGDLPENVNYAVKSSFVLPFLESLPELENVAIQSDEKRSLDRTEIIELAKKSVVPILCY
jgi:S1-C subfamily serine protease